MRMRVIFFLMPIALLLWTRLGIELSVILFPVRYAWLLAFLFYYFFITLCVLYASTRFNVSVSIRHNSLRPIPPKKYLFWGIIMPAILPIGVFILNIRVVPSTFIFYIFLFSVINPFFEETFWRGLLFHLPASDKIKMLYSSALFSFSHYFLRGTYWLADPRKWIPTVLATFIMGMLWMWFFEKQKNLLYTMISHFFVDVFNLSVAVFFGLKLVTF